MALAHAYAHIPLYFQPHRNTDSQADIPLIHLHHTNIHAHCTFFNDAWEMRESLFIVF